MIDPFYVVLAGCVLMVCGTLFACALCAGGSDEGDEP